MYMIYVSVLETNEFRGGTTEHMENGTIPTFFNNVNEFHPPVHTGASYGAPSVAYSFPTKEDRQLFNKEVQKIRRRLLPKDKQYLVQIRTTEVDESSSQNPADW